MFVASCALLIAAADAFYAPMQGKLAPRGLARAAVEGGAAPGEKQRIARRSVAKSIQVKMEIEIYAERATI